MHAHLTDKILVKQKNKTISYLTIKYIVIYTEQRVYEYIFSLKIGYQECIQKGYDKLSTQDNEM